MYGYFKNVIKLKNMFLIRRNLKILLLSFWIFLPIIFQKKILTDVKSSKYDNENKESFSNIKWKKINQEKQYENKIIWKKSNSMPLEKEHSDFEKANRYLSPKLGILGRSIVFNNSIVGPDVSWLVPPGFKWNNKYKFDTSVRGHSGRFEKGRGGKNFWAWNSGDAVGQIFYQFLNKEKTSFGFNYGIRSIYSGNALGGATGFGEGQSIGFRIDRQISPTEGFAFGAEQLLHLDGLTDTGRDIYITLSKGLWRNKEEGQFPLDIFTFGVSTGRMAEGNIKFLCSDLLGGSGTEINHQRRLCWAPVFSISRVFNKNFSTFFEYNSKWFLLGSSIIPFNEIPLRGTFAVQLSDHIDNYKLNNFDEMKWVFRISLGF